MFILRITAAGAFVAACAFASSVPADVDFVLKLNKVIVAGQNSVLGTVNLMAPEAAPVTMQISDDSTLVETPASVTVAAGELVKKFRIRVTPVAAPVMTTITAASGAIIHTQPLVLSPLAPSAMAFTPKLVTGGQPTQCRLVINGVAGPAGLTITLSDNSAFATVPATATVPPGGTQAIFSISTLAVSTRQVVVVTAMSNGLAKAATFRIAP